MKITLGKFRPGSNSHPLILQAETPAEVKRLEELKFAAQALHISHHIWALYDVEGLTFQLQRKESK